MRIGYLTSEPWFPAVPAMQRGVQIAIDVLRERGHELVPFRPPPFEKIFPIASSLLTADGNKYLLDLILSDIPEPDHSSLVDKLRVPDRIRRILAPMFGQRLNSIVQTIPRNLSENRKV